MDLLIKALQAILPQEWLRHFEVAEIMEMNTEWRITLVEKMEYVPEALKGMEAVQNGYMNPVEINDYPLRGKPTFLSFVRRRWKKAGDNESHFNHYDFHPEGMKATREFGHFLKELDRKEAGQLWDGWMGHRDPR